jgi:hypothetical protein
MSSGPGTAGLDAWRLVPLLTVMHPDAVGILRHEPGNGFVDMSDDYKPTVLIPKRVLRVFILCGRGKRRASRIAYAGRFKRECSAHSSML